jgi:hypothetical protein
LFCFPALFALLKYLSYSSHPGQIFSFPILAVTGNRNPQRPVSPHTQFYIINHLSKVTHFNPEDVGSIFLRNVITLANIKYFMTKNYFSLHLYAYEFSVTLHDPVTHLRMKDSAEWPKYYIYKASNQSANSYHRGLYDSHARQVLISSPAFSNHPAFNPIHHSEN